LRHEERPLIYDEHPSSKAEREGNARISSSKVKKVEMKELREDWYVSEKIRVRCAEV
jgi:hypothetical protein